MKGEIVVVGAGGIGAPAALALAAAGVSGLTLVDDDRVDVTNLHRQILFSEADLGRAKIDALAEALERRFPALRVTRRSGRALPETVREIVCGAAVVVDATDNFASRFLIADACILERVAVVHAAAVRWSATVLAVAPGGAPCYRCLFEDLPEGPAPDCASAGVAGPVCGVAGAVAADRALSILADHGRAFGAVVTFDGLRDELRTVGLRRRAGCPLCDARTIADIDPDRYQSASCQS